MSTDIVGEAALAPAQVPTAVLSSGPPFCFGRSGSCSLMIFFSSGNTQAFQIRFLSLWEYPRSSLIRIRQCLRCGILSPLVTSQQRTGQVTAVLQCREVCQCYTTLAVVCTNEPPLMYCVKVSFDISLTKKRVNLPSSKSP